MGLVVVFTFPEAGAPENYTVSLTYYDVDEDMVTIASSDELVDAVEQFAGQKVLRITTYVKPKTCSVSSPPFVPPQQQEARKPAPVVITDRATSTTRTDPTIPLQNVIESFVGVLSTAVHHLQEGLAAPTVNPRPPVPTSDVEAATAAPSTEGNENSPTDDAKIAEEPDTPQETTQEEATLGEAHEEHSSEATEGSTEAEEQGNEQDKLFIHGRHTCDSCLTTPIIGKRYHSTNLPDYDLCHNCFSHYGGTEIQFESVELDRDRAFQPRWHQRHKRSQMMMSKRRGRFVHGAGPRGRCFGNIPRGRGPGFAGSAHQVPPPPHPGCPPPPSGPPPHEHPHPPPNHHHHGLPHPPPHHMSPGFFNHHWAHIGPHLAPHMPPPHPIAGVNRASDFDNALKEAIRRSLNDIAPKEAEIHHAHEVVQPSAPAEDAMEEISQGIAGAENEASKVTIVETEADEDADESIEAGIPRSVDIAEQEEVEADLVDDDMAKDVAASKEHGFDETEEASAMEKLMDAASVDSEKLLADEVGAAKVDASAKRSPSNRDTSNDESFASDAVGNGDVAEAMGAALDKVAGVICEMLSEVDDLKGVLSFDSNSNTSGQVIVDSTEADDKEDEKDDSDWSVVKSVGSTETTESQQIAKAAEMLGSALFNSDMKNSKEDAMALSGSESFSIPSSVPSDIGTHTSLAAPAQCNRWAAHLAQLAELGFDDESACLDVLERHEAAHIGVDSDEEISINHVVNALLELQK